MQLHFCVISRIIVILIPVTFITMAQSSETSLDEKRNICQNLSVSCNEFTNAFHKQLSSVEKGNIISSPLSIHMILSLLSHGADAETLNELTTSLHHPEIQSLQEEYKSLISILADIKNVNLYIANAMYIQDGFNLLTEFLTVGTDVYQSLVSSLDFKNNVDAAEKINTWVKKTTNNKISDLVSADDFDEWTKLVLVNAIYFNGHWLHEFDVKNTEKKAFHVTKTESKLVPMMFKKSKYNYGEISSVHARFIEIPYMNEDIVMMIVLPNEVDGLEFLQSHFDWEMLETATRSNTDIELYLPRFTFEFTVNLESTLRKMGLSKMFEDNADFSRLANIPLKVSKVLHKAMIEVNEKGTEAAAATAVHMRLRRMIDLPEQFLVNRPFMFVIEHKPSKLPLFVGSVSDIKASPAKDEL